jgi:hypothetical protein
MICHRAICERRSNSSVDLAGNCQYLHGRRANVWLREEGRFCLFIDEHMNEDIHTQLVLISLMGGCAQVRVNGP